MQHSFLIVDRSVQIEHGVLSSLFRGFECDSENRSAPGSCNQEPICSIGIAHEPAQHGVERLDSDFPISHVLALTRDRSAVLTADDYFEHATVRADRTEGLMDLALVTIYSRLAYFRTVFVHGALVDVPGFGGIMFVGRSGVGKSTQAELWAKHAGAEIINGDKVFLSLREDAPGEVFAYGSPWRGSSPYRVNKRCSLRAIVDLKREDEKYVCLLQDTEALAAYMPSVFMPNWDIRLTGAVMETLDQMLPCVPIYRMSCENSEAAVTMLRRILAPDANVGKPS